MNSPIVYIHCCNVSLDLIWMYVSEIKCSGQVLHLLEDGRPYTASSAAIL